MCRRSSSPGAADAAVRARAAGIADRLEPQFPTSGAWLRVVFYQRRAAEATDTHRDFRQALKELLTAVTIDGIAEPELSKHTDPDVAFAQRICECVRSPSSVCGGVLGIKFDARGSEWTPVGRLVRNDTATSTICEQCQNTASCAPLSFQHEDTIRGPEPLRPCEEAENCTFNAKKAAFALLARLRQRVNMFGVFRELTISQKSSLRRAPWRQVRSAPDPVGS